MTLLYMCTYTSFEDTDEIFLNVQLILKCLYINAQCWLIHNLTLQLLPSLNISLILIDTFW